MRSIINVEAKLQWKAFKATSGRWIGVSDAMGLTMEGDTLDDLLAAINETINLVLTDLLEDNELEAYLTNKGWHAKLPENREDLAFKVPFELIVKSGYDSSRAAC